MVGAYAAVGFASLTAPKAIWSTNPVTITFHSGEVTRSSGSVGESVKCAPKVSDVVFQTKTSDPKISLTVSPPVETSCGPAPDAVTVTASCVAAVCFGRFTGTVTILQGYSTIPPSLSVTIVVT